MKLRDFLVSIASVLVILVAILTVNGIREARFRAIEDVRALKHEVATLRQEISDMRSVCPLPPRYSSL